MISSARRNDGRRWQTGLKSYTALALLSSGIQFALAAFASTPTTLSLTSSQNPSTYDMQVTLTATISPGDATGKITFYDGATVLGTQTLSAGVAMLSMDLPTEIRSIFARYLGDATHAPSTSAVIKQVVKSVTGFGFANSTQVLGTSSAIAAVADLNGDGKPDIVAVGDVTYTGNNLSVILGHGDGTFAAPVVYLIEEAYLTSLAVADFNGDGKPDIVVANSTYHNIAVLLGNGDGTFGPPTDYATADGSIVVADFNNDGNPDIAVAHAAKGAVGVLLGNGDGTFSQPHEYPTGDFPHFLVAADFNGDGNLDLVADARSFLSGNGDGTFGPPAPLPATPIFSNNYQGLAVGDLNGDGRLDLVAANAATNSVNFNGTSMSVFLGQGDGTFAPPVVYPSSGTYPEYASYSGFAVGMGIADVNGDGKADLVTVHQGPVSGTVQVFPGNGDGTLQAAAAYNTGFAPASLAMGDFNGDGRIDLALPSSSASSSASVGILLGELTAFLRVNETHSGDFAPGLTGTFTIQVSNVAGAATTSGPVTVTNSLLNLSASGDGWTCAMSCTRSDALGPNQSYPLITGNIQVDVPPTSVLYNEVTVSGGGSPLTRARDSATVGPVPDCTLAVSPKSAYFGTAGGSGSITVTLLAPCMWGAYTPTVPWVMITSPTPITGSGILRYQVAPNPNTTARTQTLLLSANSPTSIPVLFTITQAGTQYQLPPPDVTGVGTAGSHTVPIAPNTWVEIFGVYLAPDTRSWEASDFVDGQLPTQLDGVSVRVNGESAFVAYISPMQVNVLAPPDPIQGQIQVQLTNGTMNSSRTVQATPLTPAFFVIGLGPYVAATHANGTSVGPTNLLPGLTTPAKPGETVVLYGNGFGPTEPPVVSGSLHQSGILPTSPVIEIGGTVAVTEFAGLVSPGLYQFNVVVPASAPDGDNAVIAQYKDIFSQIGVVIAVQR